MEIANFVGVICTGVVIGVVSGLIVLLIWDVFQRIFKRRRPDEFDY